MENNFENLLYIGSVEDLHKVCLADVELNSDDFKSLEFPRYCIFNIKQPKEKKIYYYYIAGKEIAIARIEKLEKRILKTFEVFVYKNDVPIETFDIKIKNATTITIFINGQVVADLVDVNDSSGWSWDEKSNQKTMSLDF